MIPSTWEEVFALFDAALSLSGVEREAFLGRECATNPEARQMLAEVYGWFTEGFDTADLKEAGALLESLRIDRGMATERRR